jgi:hypothetical protein
MTRPETLLVGVYPREDVTWPDDGAARRGLIEVRAGAAGDTGTVIASQEMSSSFIEPLSPDLEVGASFSVHVTASDGTQNFDETFHFVVTGDEDDVAQYTVGPGLTVERGRWGKKTVSGFEFGATVMGASPAS